MIVTWILYTALLALHLTIPEIPAAFQPEGRLTREIDLSHWGMDSVEDIGFVSIGVLHGPDQDQMVVYDIRKEKPVLRIPDRPWGAVPEFSGNTFLVADFNEGNVNRLGGYFNGFSRAHSTADVTISRLPGGDQALTFVFTRDTSGFAGFWIHLFDFKSPPAQRIFLDSTPFSFITFSIRGEHGQEALRLQVADRIWELKEDSLPINEVGAFLPAGRITKEWQRAWVPLKSLPARVDPKELASLVFTAQRGGGRVYIRDLALTTRREVSAALSETPPEPSPPLGKGMWLWETAQLLGNPEAQKRLRSFCRDQGITDLFLQLPYRAEKEAGTWHISWDEAGMRELLTGLHSVGIICHALDGDPKYALSEYHDKVKATVREIIRFNRDSEPPARFDALRYDIEPYLLPRFAGVHKETVLRQYLALLKDLKEYTSAAGLDLGVDIPFWFDARSRFFEPVAELEGRPITEKILEIVDNIGIMDYRTRAYGADGTIAQAVDEMRYADKLGKTVFVGLETVPLPDETILDFEKTQGPSMLRIRQMDGTRVRLEWSSSGSDLTEKGAGQHTLFQANRIEVAASRITFQDKTWEDLDAVMRKTARELGRYKSFYGFAIHSYESFRPWLERQKKGTSTKNRDCPLFAAAHEIDWIDPYLLIW